ncbi:conserved hypothetical protein [Gammaproteobacteria bacterium]
MISRNLLAFLRKEFTLDWHGIHGVSHWARVRNIGLRLARVTGARTEIVELFAFLHDSKRQSERRDPEHGPRAAELVKFLNGSLIYLDDESLWLLIQACAGHSEGLLEADPTVQTCWDADRLDLGRVGVRPLPEFLCTEAARNPAMIQWAFLNSQRQRERLSNLLAAEYPTQIRPLSTFLPASPEGHP